MSTKQRTMLTPRGVVLCVIIGGMLFTSVYPLRHYLQYRTNISALHREDRRLDTEIVDLSAEQARLQTDSEIERLAREELGMVRPGERPFVIVSPAPAPPDVTEIASSAPDHGPLLKRWWHAVGGALRALT